MVKVIRCHRNNWLGVYTLNAGLFPLPAARFAVFLFIFLLIFVFAPPAFPQALPYIADIASADNSNKMGSDPSLSAPHRLCTFKLFNPDTVPFYIWVSFENRGKLKHIRYGDEYHGLRLVDLELRYKNAMEQPIVKKFPPIVYDSRAKKRFSGSWFGSTRSKRNGQRAEFAGEEEIGVADGRGGGRRGASEIAFWKEDAQGYYEMELWGVLYGPDLDDGVVAGGYRDVVSFEIEAMK